MTHRQQTMILRHLDTLPSPPRAHPLRQALWGFTFLVCLYLYVLALPLRFTELTTTGTATYQLALLEIALLTDAQVSVTVYAVFMLLFEALQTLGFVTMSIWLIWRRLDDFMPWFTAVMLLIVGTIAPATVQALNRAPNPPEVLLLLQFLRFVLPIFFFYMFPDGLFQPRWSVWFALGAAVVLAFLPMLAGYPDNWAFLVQAGAVMLWILPVLLAQYYRFRMIASVEQQQQIKWVLLGLTLLSLVSIVRYLLLAFIPDLNTPSAARLLLRTVLFVPIFDTLAFWLLPFTIAASMFQYRLYNIDLPLNRSVVYGAVLLTLFIVFMIGFFLIQGVLRLVGISDLSLAVAIATTFVAASFNPVQRRLRHLIDTRLFGLREDLADLAQQQAQYSAQQVSPLPRDSLSGQQIGSYVVENVIGRGGMGEVYRARHISLGRSVAIKTLLPSLAAEQEFRGRFEQEAKMLAGLQHPNIVSVYDVGILEHVYYMVMDFVEGDALREVIRGGALPLEVVIPIVKDIAAALDYAHERNLVHRDVKPSNVILQTLSSSTRKFQRAVLLDFGVAKLRDAQTSYTGSGMVGTLDYASPEQILNSKTVDKRADVYGLGVMTYQMLTGALPFRGYVGEVVFAHLHQPPPDPRTLVPDLPPNAAEAILQALAKNPADRFESAGAFAQALAKEAATTTP